MEVIKYIQLPFRFNAATLQAEIAALETVYWKMHYNKKHYSGNWSIIPLRALYGKAELPYSVHQTSAGQIPYADTPLLQQCPYIQEVLNSLLFEKTSVRLMKLDAGAVINPHCDQDMAFEQGEIRLHIPVSTNPGVAFYIEEERIPMQEGECWYLNLQLQHRVRNDGDTHRVHLVVDGLVNDWVNEVFSQPGLNKKQHHDTAYMETGISTADKEKIVRELRLLNTPETNREADRLEGLSGN
ncbi:MAG: aspartyl/asparaginyl beta-hydroxylase domain-containing protein [Dinghuibacter sp.]|nr:aspartyl/asparaginyl beta-hydroxylase domain-containing protein [Dinghuibacter sp.]